MQGLYVRVELSQGARLEAEPRGFRFCVRLRGSASWVFFSWVAFGCEYKGWRMRVERRKGIAHAHTLADLLRRFRSALAWVIAIPETA